METTSQKYAFCVSVTFSEVNARLRMMLACTQQAWLMNKVNSIPIQAESSL
jgi:hypothetical protein